MSQHTWELAKSVCTHASGSSRQLHLCLKNNRRGCTYSRWHDMTATHQSLRDAAWVWYHDGWPPALPTCGGSCSSCIPAVPVMLPTLSCGAGATALRPTASRIKPSQRSQPQLLQPRAPFNGKRRLRSSYFSLIERVRLTMKHFREIKADFSSILLPFWKGIGA